MVLYVWTLRSVSIVAYILSQVNTAVIHSTELKTCVQLLVCLHKSGHNRAHVCIYLATLLALNVSLSLYNLALISLQPGEHNMLSRQLFPETPRASERSAAAHETLI